MTNTKNITSRGEQNRFKSIGIANCTGRWHTRIVSQKSHLGSYISCTQSVSYCVRRCVVPPKSFERSKCIWRNIVCVPPLISGVLLLLSSKTFGPAKKLQKWPNAFQDTTGYIFVFADICSLWRAWTWWNAFQDTTHYVCVCVHEFFVFLCEQIFCTKSSKCQIQLVCFSDPIWTSISLANVQ